VQRSLLPECSPLCRSTPGGVSSAAVAEGAVVQGRTHIVLAAMFELLVDLTIPAVAAELTLLHLSSPSANGRTGASGDDGAFTSRPWSLISMLISILRLRLLGAHLPSLCDSSILYSCSSSSESSGSSSIPAPSLCPPRPCP
jgi:hypothetical protein